MIWQDSKPTTLYMEKEHMAWLDSLKKRFGIARQWVLHDILQVAMEMEKQNPGSITKRMLHRPRERSI